MTADYWTQIPVSIRGEGSDGDVLLLELQPRRNSILHVAPVAIGARVGLPPLQTRQLNSRCFLFGVRDRERAQRYSFPAGRYELIVLQRGEPAAVARFERARARGGGPVDLAAPTDTQQGLFPSLVEVFGAKQVDDLEGARVDADSEFFADYDAESYFDELETIDRADAWTDLRVNALRLEPDDREKRRAAIRELQYDLFGRAAGRGFGPRDTTARDAAVAKHLDVMDLFHHRILARHFRKCDPIAHAAHADPLACTLDAAAAGRAYARFANLELGRNTAIGSANYQNGLPNSMAFACLAELFDALARVGTLPAEWAALKRQCIAGILLLARAAYRCNQSMPRFDATPTGSAVGTTLREQIEQRFAALDEHQLSVAWSEVIRAAIPWSIFTKKSNVPKCGAQRLAVDRLVTKYSG